MMLKHPEPFRFCWLDLAASDAQTARSFYGALLGWRANEQPAGGGHFTRFILGDAPVASMYPLNRSQLSDGVPSHWTPYVAVADIADSALRAEALGAQVLVQPFELPGIARVCLIQDPVGACIGLWQNPER